MKIKSPVEIGENPLRKNGYDGGITMNYFILYVTSKAHTTSEYYIKGKSIDYIVERMGRYSNGCIATSKLSFCTYNAISMFVREIDLKHFPYLSKKDFGTINETKSYDLTDLK
ncbi:hypothetical protein RCG23_13625 [Neobacillus sp. PS3-34]|uniref:hypothetical protein n=1 Tax=Neobacillus sp. PS3-34 TaxID=3070678 RepID=UPI0027E0B969|nr:hypothetical protein [Neobacillus sp. PS3-34]WML46688.1 hypothetical protein RCG23_13625 [Neobacillus sp. PS3-34]